MNHTDNQRGGIYGTSLLILFVVAFAFYGCKDVVSHFTSKERELITENKELKKAISNLTEESQIGYAKVISQEKRDGRLFTTLRFVETDRNDPSKKVLEREYTIEGNIVYFDAIIIKFFNQMIMDGKEKSLYLWRKVYGERMSPESGFSIETEGKEPERYADIFSKLSIDTRDQFWTQIWNLADDPNYLRENGIQAIFGSVVYKKLSPNVIYIFKIDNKGYFYPETVPEF